jgi:hypothetical protein
MKIINLENCPTKKKLNKKTRAVLIIGGGGGGGESGQFSLLPQKLELMDFTKK